MIVRLLKPWSQWSAGHVFTEMPGGQARMLIDRNLAVEVKESPALQSPVNRMVDVAAAIVKRGPGRPPKAAA